MEWRRPAAWAQRLLSAFTLWLSACGCLQCKTNICLSESSQDRYRSQVVWPLQTYSHGGISGLVYIILGSSSGERQGLRPLGSSQQDWRSYVPFYNPENVVPVFIRYTLADIVQSFCFWVLPQFLWIVLTATVDTSVFSRSEARRNRHYHYGVLINVSLSSSWSVIIS